MARKHHQEQTEAIRKLIIDAALQICLEDGYREVTVRRIGDKIGYSTGVIYYHFKDKQDILSCLDRRLDEETYKNIGGLIDPDKSLKDNLIALFEYTCDLAYNDQEAYKRIFTASRIENNFYTRNLWLKLTEECLNKAAERGEIDGSDIDAMAKNIVSFILGYNYLCLEFERVPDMETCLANGYKAVDMLLGGILKK